MNMMTRMFIFLLMALSLPAHAEVFKCKSASGKIIYQPEPCAAGTVPQGVIKVKEMTPEEAEEAKAKLNAWQGQQAADDAAKAEAEKQRQIELDRQESLELQRRSVMAQEKEAAAAAAAQQRPVQSIGVYIPPYGYGGRNWNNPYDFPYGSNPYQVPYGNNSGYPPYDNGHHPWILPMPPPSPGTIPEPQPNRPGSVSGWGIPLMQSPNPSRHGNGLDIKHKNH
jgi:hypothetical protein